LGAFFPLSDFWLGNFLIFNNEVPKILDYFPHLSLSFIFEKNVLGNFLINSSGPLVHARHNYQTSLWGRAKANSFSHFSLPENPTMGLLDV
jgi:hypothetical protein